MGYFKAFIRVVKSLNNEGDKNFYGGFDTVQIIKEPLIIAENKEDVKKYLLKKYPQFFPKNKVYCRETKDQAQFFYVVIYPLFNNEIELVKNGEWICRYCGEVHENKYVSRPYYSSRLFGDEILFCNNDDNYCFNSYKKDHFKNIDLPDNEYYVSKESPIFIYKITEKATNKCYIGKTKNAPFFRWWDHLTKSNSPFGLYLRQTRLQDWTFEVINELPYNTEESTVLKIESEKILLNNSINNGFNSIISNKNAQVSNEIKFPNK